MFLKQLSNRNGYEHLTGTQTNKRELQPNIFRVFSVNEVSVVNNVRVTSYFSFSIISGVPKITNLKNYND